jgi:hypothetical protein
MAPNPDLIKILQEHKCKVAFKEIDERTFYLLIRYDELVKNKPNQGFEVWGRNQQVLDNIATTVRRYYPLAELSSQDARASVVYKIVGTGVQPIKIDNTKATKPVKRK